MKSYGALLVALGMLSSNAFAQAARPEPLPEPSRLPMPTLQSDTAVPATTDRPAMSGEQENGEMSSGSSSDASARSATGGTGQLITPAMSQPRASASAAADVGIQPQTKNGVTYLCGGVGDEETAYMKEAAARGYDLMLTFAEKSGNYVANVAVAIKDAHGKTLLETTCDGPLMLVELPAGGGYRIHAEAGGKAIERTVLVKGGKGRLRQLTFAWPSTGTAPVAAEKR